MQTIAFVVPAGCMQSRTVTACHISFPIMFIAAPQTSCFPYCLHHASRHDAACIGSLARKLWVAGCVHRRGGGIELVTLLTLVLHISTKCPGKQLPRLAPQAAECIPGQGGGHGGLQGQRMYACSCSLCSLRHQNYAYRKTWHLDFTHAGHMHTIASM